jgi:hypothetical protein
MYHFLVTTDINRLPSMPIVMVDGTVPGWAASGQDLHFDHHCVGGAKVQIEEIPEGQKLPQDFVFVTTQVDADACAAAAWLLIEQCNDLDPAEMYEARAALTSIAYDCDHLGCPEDAVWNPYRRFAAKAVAAMKESGNALAEALELPKVRKDWTEDQKVQYASKAFESGTMHLVAAARGARPWPGAMGEADSYFARMEAQRPKVYANCRMIWGCAVFDQRGFNEYVDPRLLVEWARENSAIEPVTLTVRNGRGQPNANFLSEYSGELFSYTLGSVPLHAKSSPCFNDHGVWEALQALELRIRAENQQLKPLTAWGGRNEVGGSSWRDPVIATPEQVIDTVVTLLH